MLVVRKLDLELLWFRWIAKGKAGVIIRRHLCMAVSTDNGLRAFEKLRPMTTHTGVMVRIVRDIGKPAHFFPVRRRVFVACIAGFLMLFGGVRESRVINSRRRHTWRLSRAPAPLGDGAAIIKVYFYTKEPYATDDNCPGQGKERSAF